ncbi:protein ATP11 [Kluyveromyces marxianus]|uniref:Protein ATP11 n=2 Tax=Kluyveromyces marxianus TaxID=4911 RepID=W0TGR8_KLUMD|nr:protein ATP11 [Kluyveromyces marxianus DMKU3-1042]QGN18144.1 protein ATP11 [Kluyveromyces marxianus]BAO42011.1 protein ATP11 [Kluyveromyces marxianus DMKU3-1042]BAP73430.1 protein ATP11 [Kluyveromyces marxianus]
MIKSWTRVATRSASQLTAAQFKRIISASSSLYSTSNYSTESLDQKYKDKLLEKAREQGYNSIEELKNALKEEIEKKKLELNKIDPLKELEDYEQRTKMSSNIAKSRGPIDPSTPKMPYKTLDSFLDVEKVKNLSKQECEFLWRARWANKDNVLTAVVPIDVWNKMSALAKENPYFVIPLPRESAVVEGNEESNAAPADKKEPAVEMHYIQWQFVGPKTVHCIMTTLAEFKLHKEYARPHTTLQFHLDLAEDKNIVLMNGQVETDSNVTLPESQLLVLNVQRFYGAMGQDTSFAKKRVQLLKDFTSGSPQFNVDLLVALAQTME